MKSDIDSLMQAHALDALLITGPGKHNPAMVYMTGGGHLTRADLIKKRGDEPVLFHYSMERDEAANTGLRTKNLDEYDLMSLYKEADGDQVKMQVARYQKMFADMGISAGRIAIYGQSDAGGSYAIFTALQQAMPELTIVGELGNTVAPISKEVIQQRVPAFTGHTEFLARLSKTRSFGMMLAGEKLKVSLVTVHLPLKKALRPINREKILQTIKLTHRTLTQWFGLSEPLLRWPGSIPMPVKRAPSALRKRPSFNRRFRQPEIMDWTSRDPIRRTPYFTGPPGAVRTPSSPFIMTRA